MRPTNPLTPGTEEPLAPELREIEEILRSAADFEPETEASYNFAAAAMSRQRFRSRTLWMAAAGCACTAILVACVLPHFLDREPSLVFVGQPQVESAARIAEDDGATGTSTWTQEHLTAEEFANKLRPQPQYSPANIVNYRVPANKRADTRPASALGQGEDDAPAPKARWESETVDRYATGLLQPTYVEEKNADGTRVRKPAVEIIPLQRGERPAAEGASDMGVISLADYNAKPGEGLK